MEIKKYDVLQVNLGNTLGSEQGGVRPVLVLQNNLGNKYSNTTIIAPFSTKIKSLNIPTHAFIKRGRTNGLNMDSILLTEQIRVISEMRIIKKLGTITNEKDIKEIKRAYQANFVDITA